MSWKNASVLLALLLIAGILPAGLIGVGQAAEKEEPDVPVAQGLNDAPHVKAFVDHVKNLMEIVKTGKHYVSGERIVVFGGASVREMKAVSVELSKNVGALAHKVVGVYEKAGRERLIVLMKFTDEQAAIASEQVLRRHPMAKFVTKNYIVTAGPFKPEPLSVEQLVRSSESVPVQQALSSPNDPLRVWQWNLILVGAIGTPGIAIPGPAAPPVAVIDTGVDYNHPDLSGKVILGYDYVNDDADPMDDQGHGTHVAGIAAAKTNNRIGIAGVSPNSRIYAVKVLDENGVGTWDDVLAGVIEAVSAVSPKGVINLSLGGLGTTDEKALWDDIFSWALSEGVVPVCAAGNDANLLKYFFDFLNVPGYELTTLPAASEFCVTVAATQEQDHRAYFSNYGTSSDYGEFEVDIAAPGHSGRMGLPSGWGQYGILSTLPGNMYGWASGTSMAAPHVAGAIARVWASFPSLTPSGVVSKVLTSSKVLGINEGFPVMTPRLNLPDALLAPTAAGRRGILVNVIDGDTGMPLSGASISGVPGGVFSTTQSGWAFRRGASAGTYTITVSKPGYISETRSITIPSASTVELMVTLVKRKPSTFNTIVVTWDSVDPGIMESLVYFDFEFSFEHPDMPSFVTAGGSGPRPFFCIDESPAVTCNEEVLYTPSDMGSLFDWYQAAIPYNARFVWRPVQAIVFREKNGLHYTAYMSSVPGWFIFSWGGISTGSPETGGAAAFSHYKGTSRLLTRYSTADATGTSAFWWLMITKSGTGAPTAVNQRIPPQVLKVRPVIESRDKEVFTVWRDVGTPQVILVDNDGSAGYTDELLIDYSGWYEQALSGTTVTGYRYWDVHFAGPPTTGDLTPFKGSGKAVITYTGDDFLTTFSRFERDVMTSFLSTGGRAFMTGQDIGYDMCGYENFWGPSPEKCSWFENTLKAEYVADYSDILLLEGVSGDPVSDGLTITIYGEGGADNQGFPSVIVPASDANTIFTYEYDGKYYDEWPGAIRWASGDNKLVYFAFGFEAITAPINPNHSSLGQAMRVNVLQRVLSYLLS